MTARLVSLVLALTLAGVAWAAGWSVYGNARYGYLVDLPAGFTAIREAANSDGGTSSSPEGNAAFSAWGSNLIDQSFAQDVGSRIASDSQEGWTIGYRAVAPKGAAWSGSRGGRIVYVRAIPLCRDQAAFVRIEYDAASKSAFDPIVSRIARSLKAGGGC